MHRAAVFTALLVLALASGAPRVSACSNFGSSNCTPPDSAYDRIYTPPEVYVPYGYEGPVVYGYTGYAPRYYGYAPGYGPRYYGYAPSVGITVEVDD